MAVLGRLAGRVLGQLGETWHEREEAEMSTRVIAGPVAILLCAWTGCGGEVAPPPTPGTATVAAAATNQSLPEPGGKGINADEECSCYFDCAVGLGSCVDLTCPLHLVQGVGEGTCASFAGMIYDAIKA